MDEVRSWADAQLHEKPYHPLAFFAEAVALTRVEPGVSIRNIANCFKKQFDEAELESLIRELQTKEILHTCAICGGTYEAMFPHATCYENK